MEIHLNITFPKMPCELLTLDVMDVSGEQQHGVAHGVNKVRLQPPSKGGGVIDIKSLNLHDESASRICLQVFRPHLLEPRGTLEEAPIHRRSHRQCATDDGA